MMEDPDEKMLLIFDSVDLFGHTNKMVMLDIYIGRTEWDIEDNFAAIVTTDFGDFTLLNMSGTDIDDLSIESFWMTNSSAIPDAATTASPMVMLSSNANDEEFWLDNIRFLSTPESEALTFPLSRGHY